MNLDRFSTLMSHTNRDVYDKPSNDTVSNSRQDVTVDDGWDSGNHLKLALIQISE